MRKRFFTGFRVKPNGWGQGHFTVLVEPRLGFFASLWDCLTEEEYISVKQKRFIEEAIEEKLQREWERVNQG